MATVPEESRAILVQSMRDCAKMLQLIDDNNVEDLQELSDANKDNITALDTDIQNLTDTVTDLD